MALGSIDSGMFGLRRKDDTLFEPRMPEVDTPATVAALFDKARSTAAAGVGDGARRCVVIVTPGRLLMLQPCPSPGSMSDQQEAGMRQLLPGPPRHVVAIGYTELTALQTDIAKAIPFIGMLLGLAYVGHADQHLAVALLAAHIDLPARRRVANSIVEQVQQHLPQPQAVADNLLRHVIFEKAA